MILVHCTLNLSMMIWLQTSMRLLILRFLVGKWGKGEIESTSQSLIIQHFGQRRKEVITALLNRRLNSSFLILSEKRTSK